MKKSLILIALAMVAALSVVSCKNSNKTKEPTQEEVQEQKQALADSVLAKIDAIVDNYINVSDDTGLFVNLTLTDEEKLVKPDYLLDPSEASKFVTLEQKVNALAIYLEEHCIRLLYDMPTDETLEVISKLAAEVNHPTGVVDKLSDKVQASEIIRTQYNDCKRRGEISYFWKFENAVLRETDYLITQNPELYLNKIGEENYNSRDEQWRYFFRAIWSLAPYDEEMNQLYQTLECKTDEAYESSLVDFTSAIEFCNKNKDHFAALRNALLQ